jgi:hypothetical protein
VQGGPSCRPPLTLGLLPCPPVQSVPTAVADMEGPKALTVLSCCQANCDQRAWVNRARYAEELSCP